MEIANKERKDPVRRNWRKYSVSGMYPCLAPSYHTLFKPARCPRSQESLVPNRRRRNGNVTVVPHVLIRIESMIMMVQDIGNPVRSGSLT